MKKKEQNKYLIQYLKDNELISGDELQHIISPKGKKYVKAKNVNKRLRKFYKNELGFSPKDIDNVAIGSLPGDKSKYVIIFQDDTYSIPQWTELLGYVIDSVEVLQENYPELNVETLLEIIINPKDAKKLSEVISLLEQYVHNAFLGLDIARIINNTDYDVFIVDARVLSSTDIDFIIDYVGVYNISFMMATIEGVTWHGLHGSKTYTDIDVLIEDVNKLNDGLLI